MPDKTVFVTVGTTQFDELIKIVTSDEVLQALNDKGYNRLILQIGKTEFVPDCSLRYGFNHISSFQLSPSLQEFISSADLVISHAGAGTCLEVLELKKPLLVVTNSLLMDNHQLELAEQLYEDGYLIYSDCDNLLNIIKSMNLTTLKPFPGDKSKKIANVIDDIMGFS